MKSEFAARAERLKSAEAEKAQQSQEREQRMAQFNKACDELRDVWRPRLEEFAKQFGESVKITPTVSPAAREAKVLFNTDLANVNLTLSVTASADIAKLVLDYDLRIIPMFFEYERTSRLEVPLNKIDRDAVGRWLDDRLVSCVKAYLSIQDNQYYLKRAMVEDPITKAKFLPDNAAATLQHDGRTHYFSSSDSLREFKMKHQIA